MLYFSPLIKVCLVVLALATSILTGVIIARMTKEELSSGKKYFRVIIWSLLIVIVAVVDSWLMGLISGVITLTVVLTLAYFFVVTLVSLLMSKHHG